MPSINSIKNNKDKNHLFSDFKLAIVSPMANESENVELFVARVLEICSKFRFKAINFFAVVDKASRDGTIDILYGLSKKYSELNVIYSPENRNVVDAYIRGYQEAIDSNNDWILEIDAGFSHQPDDIPNFFFKMKEGYDCVFGSRFYQGGKTSEVPMFRYILSKGGTVLCKIFLKTRLTDMTSGFELFRRDVLLNILSKGIYSVGPVFQTEIKAHAHEFNIAEVPIFYRAPNYKFKMIEIYDSFKNLFRLYRLRFRDSI